MPSRLVSILPCLSLILFNVVFSVLLKMTLCILLGCRFKVFLYSKIVFLQLMAVCFAMMSCEFFLAFFPMVLSIICIFLLALGHLEG